MAEKLTYQPLLTNDVKDLMATRGWDKGFMVYTDPLSEAGTKVLSAATLLTSRADDFGFPCKEFTLVMMDFNDKDTWTPGGKGKLGVWSPAWRQLSGNGPMPGYSMDGTLYLDSCQILAAFTATYKDKTLTAAEQADVEYWVGLNEKYQDVAMQATKHWGWTGFHATGITGVPKDRFEKSYAEYAKGKKDLEWEKATIKELDKFLTEIDEKLANKPVSGYLVAGKTTLADCAMASWYHTLSDIANVDIEHRYPNMFKHYKKKDELVLPEGAKEHQEGFTMFGKVVHLVSACKGDRNCCGMKGTHDINNPVLWP